MDTWYSVNLGDGIMAASPREEIKERFEKDFVVERNLTHSHVKNRRVPAWTCWQGMSVRGRYCFQRIAGEVQSEGN